MCVYFYCMSECVRLFLLYVRVVVVSVIHEVSLFSFSDTRYALWWFHFHQCIDTLQTRRTRRSIPGPSSRSSSVDPASSTAHPRRTDGRRPVARDGGLVLPRDAPRTGGDVVVFHRRRGHGDAPDRPARRVRVVRAADDERAERGGGGGGVATGGARGVSGAIVSARALSVRTDERGEGRGEEDEEERLAARFNSDGKNGVNKRRTTLQKRFNSVDTSFLFYTQHVFNARTRTRSRGKETPDVRVERLALERRRVADASAGPTSTSDGRYTKQSTRGDVDSTSFESMAKNTAKFQRQKAARFGTKSHPDQTASAPTVGYAHITTDVDRVRPSRTIERRTTPSCSLILSPHHHRRRLNASRLVSSRSSIASSSVARKRPAPNHRSCVVCAYTTARSRTRASRRVTTTPLRPTPNTSFHGQVVRRPLRKGKIAGSNPVESI